ncbi:MAG TPA: hypothetical protein HPP77_06180 [Candidatus Hydrogenedentes bacterium]|nr:hypothetical protein [Candidatus Hydrogenedentota bacterium]HIJ73216.1 hypothetical protein [Candidatus Hydrogenedentota bacterium]
MRKCISWILVLGILLLWTCTCFGDTGGPTREELLEIIRAAEQSIRNFRYVAVMDTYDVADDGEGALRNYGGEWEGVIAPGADPWFNIHNAFRAMEYDPHTEALLDIGLRHDAASSYNGDVARQLMYRGPAGDEPDLGAITREPRLDMTTPELLLPYLLPCFAAYPRFPKDGLPIYQPRGLANYLDNVPPEWGDWQFRQSASPHILEIEIPWGDDGSVNVVAIDLSRGANIIKSEIWNYYGTAEADCLHRMGDVLLEQHGDVWLPASFTVSSRPGGAIACYGIYYDGVNEDLDKSDFVLEFPDGVKVFDAIRGVEYIAGEAEDAPEPPPAQAPSDEERDTVLASAVTGLQQLRTSMPNSPEPERPAPPRVSGRASSPERKHGASLALLCALALALVVLFAARGVFVRRSRAPAE